MKRTIDEIAKPPASNLSKTERRRLAKRAKKERWQESRSSEPGKASTSGEIVRKGENGSRPKMTKEERKAKYTRKAYESRDKLKKTPGAKNTRCLGCRAWGHLMANCPEAKANTGICFNCGSKEHPLRKCLRPKQEDGSLPYATCFVCKQKGHLSANCERNANGIYPKGGSCKGCGSKHHLSRNCPDRPQSVKKKASAEKDETVGSDDEVQGRTSNELSEHERQNAVEGIGGVMNQGNSGGDVKIAAHVLTGDGRKVKRPTARGAGTSTRGRGGRAAARFPGGDDLEDDGYFDFDDAPELQSANPPESDDERKATSQSKKAGGKGGKKKVQPKVIMF